MDKGKWQIQACGTGIGLALCVFMCASLAVAKADDAHGGGGTHLPAALSGEYVWYKDNTFKQESYIGFLYYNETALAMRYYAPTDIAARLPERAIDLYVTVKDGALTGEKVIGASDDDGVIIVNYLHDLYYDMGLASREASAGGAIPPFEERTTNIELMSFGGEVAAESDAFTPVFGVRRVLGKDNTVMLEAVTVGRLTSAEDESFSGFHGFAEPAANTAKKGAKKAKKIKAQKPVEIAAGELLLTLDALWKRSMENMWMLGDDAMVTVAELGSLDDESLARYARRLVQSTGGDYIDWRGLKLEMQRTQGRGCVPIKACTVQADGTRVMTYRRLQQSAKSSTWYLFTLTVFDNTYQVNRTYFDGILKSVR